ncbi:hypothetical protein OL229_19045 [Neisseriaceae bacterium JH1-16]|nr:hypothetical protein [Neisseriaceae bacterium JH1-16]
MAIKADGVLGRIAELWGEVPSARERRWLWMCLKFFSDGPPTQFSQFYNPAIERTIKSKGQFLGGDIEFELEKLLVIHATSIPVLRMGRFFNQLTDFDWIDGNDVRQLCWLIDHIHKGLNIEVPEARARLIDRDYFICLTDIVSLPIENKLGYLSNLHRSWMGHLKDTFYLNWFNDDKDPGRCAFSWKTLDSRLKSTSLDSIQLDPIIGQEFRKYPGGVGLKCYFDSLQVSDFEKKSHVGHVKKLWSQKKYREKLEKDKVRQRNFVLSDTTMKNLDKLAKGLDVSRTEALERLIELAARHGMPGTQAGSDATPNGALP